MVQSRPPAFKIHKYDCTGYMIRDFAGLNTKGRYTRCFDPIKKELVEFEYNKPKASVKDGLTGSTIETLDGEGQQDRAIVRDSIEIHANRGGKSPKESDRTISMEIPGNAALLSGVTVELPEEDWLRNGGRWVVRESMHVLNVDTGYKTSIVLKR